MIQWIREHFLATVVLVALIASPVVTIKQSNSDDRQQTSDQVTGCVAASARASYNANVGKLLHDRVGARNNKGDSKSAAEYLAAGRAVVDTIPQTTPNKHIADVVAKLQPDGTYKYVLTDQAKALQIAGCKAHYHVK